MAAKNFQINMDHNNPFIQKPSDPEHLPNTEALHAYLLETENSPKGQLTKKLPDLPKRKQICKDFFHCDIWQVEPYLLDDLAKAKKSHDEEAIHHIREMIRSASWASHGRTDTKICLDLLRKLQYKDPLIKSALEDFLCNETIENAVQNIEREIQINWKKLLANNAQTEKARETLHALRPIRDQLYFQRLYKKLCAFGKQQASTS